MRYVRKLNPDPLVADAWTSYWRRPDGTIDAVPMTEAEHEDVITSRHRVPIVVDGETLSGALPFPPSIAAEHRLLGYTLSSGGAIFIEPFSRAEQAAIDAGRAYRAWGWVRASDGALYSHTTAEWRWDTPSGELEPGDVTDAYDVAGIPWTARLEDGREVGLPPEKDVVVVGLAATLVDVPVAEVPARIAERERKARDLDALFAARRAR